MNENTLRKNWRQFSLLLWINACIGGMVGMERIVFPSIAKSIFGIEAALSLVQFVVSFGLAKAITNLYTGKIITFFGRKPVLIIGWLISLAVPLLLWIATDWWQIVLINLLLGISQGLLWSTAVVMKIELAGDKQRGLAIGLNEFTGYLSVGAVAWLSTFIVEHFGLFPYPYFVGILLSAFGLFSTLFFLKETVAGTKIWKQKEKIKISKKVKVLSFAGLVNNWNDAVIWVIAPVFLILRLNAAEVAIVLSLYPITWGVGQLFTGWLSDKLPHKKFIQWGMTIQGCTLLGFVYSGNFALVAISSILLGIGTALVYPTFMSALVVHLNVEERVQSLSVYRFWRDMGYAVGALSSGFLIQSLGIKVTFWAISVLTISSGWIAAHFVHSNQEN